MKKTICVVLCFVILVCIIFSISINVNAEQIDGKSFSKTIGDFECVIYDSNTLVIERYIGSDSKVVIPNFIEGYDVTGISTSAFAGCTSLSSIVFGTNIEFINDFAFVDCTKLLSVSIPKNINNIGAYAFGYMSPLPDHAFTPYCNDFTIYGSLNSEAEKYAKDNNFRFVETKEDNFPSIIGDVDRNKIVDIVDSTAIQKYLAELVSKEMIDKLSADVNSDEIVDVVDATNIQKMLACLSNLDGSVPYDSMKEINNDKTVIITNALELNDFNIDRYSGSKIEFKNASIRHSDMSIISFYSMVFSGVSGSPDLATFVVSSNYDLDNFVDKTISGVAKIVEINSGMELVRIFDIVEIY